jgi:hypothetical protein
MHGGIGMTDEFDMGLDMKGICAASAPFLAGNRQTGPFIGAKFKRIDESAQGSQPPRWPARLNLR